jgi:hypothetical protein
LEDENCHFPLFGIPALKRLSGVRTIHLPLSRETFNAFARTFVKYNFRLISAYTAEFALTQLSTVWKCQKLLNILPGYLSWHRVRCIAASRALQTGFVSRSAKVTQFKQLTGPRFDPPPGLDLIGANCVLNVAY